MVRRRSRKSGSPRPGPQEQTGPPTVISLNWDYSYDSVLENHSPGVAWVELLEPRALGLSEPLIERLSIWLHKQDALAGQWLNRSDDGRDEYAAGAAELEREFMTLAYDVQHELAPDVEVLLRGRPLR